MVLSVKLSDSSPATGGYFEAAETCSRDTPRNVVYIFLIHAAYASEHFQSCGLDKVLRTAGNQKERIDVLIAVNKIFFFS
jgi:hypothetical protein